MYKELIKSFFQLSSSTVLIRILNMVRAFAVARLLLPAEQGVWSLLQLLVVYGTSSHLGLLNSMNREIPFLLGKGDERKVEIVEGTVSRGTFWLSIIAVVFIAGFSRIYIKNLFYETVVISISIIFVNRYNYYLIFLTTRNDFLNVSKFQFYQALIDAVVIVLCSIIWGLEGAIWGFVVSYFFVSFLIQSKIKGQCRPAVKNFETKLAVDLVKIGLPILAAGMCHLAFSTSDRLVIAKYLNTEELGYYSIANMIYGAYYVFPLVAATIVYPRMTKRFGMTGTRRSLIELFEVATLVNVMLMPLMIIGTYEYIPIVVSALLPKYKDGIVPAQVLVVSGYFSSLSTQCSNVLLTINKQVRYLVFIISGLILNLLVDVTMCKLGYGIIGVSIGTGFVLSLFGIALTVYTTSELGFSTKEKGLFFGKIVVPSAVMLLFVYLMRNRHLSTEDILSKTAITVSLFSLYCFFVLLWNKKFQILSSFKRISF